MWRMVGHESALLLVYIFLAQLVIGLSMREVVPLRTRRLCKFHILKYHRKWSSSSRFFYMISSTRILFVLQGDWLFLIIVLAALTLHNLLHTACFIAFKHETFGQDMVNRQVQLSSNPTRGLRLGFLSIVGTNTGFSLLYGGFSVGVLQCRFLGFSLDCGVCPAAYHDFNYGVWWVSESSFHLCFFPL